MGLCADAGSGQVCVVRRALVSYLRPAGLLERLWLSELTEPEDLCAPDDRLQADVARLVQCCRLLEGHLSEQLWAAVRQDLAHLVPPDAIAASVVAKVSEEPTAEFAAFRDLLAERLAAMDSLSAALARLVEFLQVDGGPLPPAEGAGPALSSRLGTGLLAATVRQTVRLRFSVATSLVLLQTLALKLSERCRLQAEHESYIRARFLPESVIQVQAYFALLWLSETPAEAVSGDSQETARRQLAALTVQEAPPAAAAAVSVAAGRLSLLELFAAGAGGAAARAASGPAAGLHSLPEQAAALLRLVWPGGAHSQLPELLLASCQHAALREYVRLHSTWCDRNSASRCLLRGLALLNLGQPDKACDVLVASADSVGLDEPLLARLLRLDPAPDEPHSRLLVRYYLRVIRLLELHHLPDYVLELASAGIAVAEEADPNVATLWAIAFKYHLRLGHVQEAYAAMTGNPDASSRGDCLHQLVVTLHERRQLATLVQLPYVDMLGDVVAILENRARAADPLAPQFYDVLYAFHVARSNYRKAAAVMYEWARRLAGEPAGLARQARCYLACVNALQLVSAEYAWIVRPEVEERGAPAVTVLTLDEIRREADLVAAQLRLREWEARDGGGAPPAGVSALSAEELLARLVAARLYTDAVQVARAHRLSAQPVVRELAAALASGAPDGSAWQWLGRCQLPAGAAGAGSAAEQTAALLRHVLADAPAGDTRLLRAAAERFLQLGRPLPAWLAADYERRAAAELGRLLLRAGQLEAAGRLLVRLLEALLGAGPERFGAGALHAAAPPVWLPYTLVDQVRAELAAHRHSAAYAELHRQLDGRLLTYQQTVQRVSRDMAAVR
ncbi:nuclear pore complex protein Nup160-like [Amphibalanus amphitrite]|uniref:nuclear pore complex protein Nup160-like n=1 Tax=Amphibalanus amphitrite TaxID=1232801 RepID=UPI001C924DCE|nr:nuclear pore complex protein Nup160-like [Amphibalanus amphitrite]